MSVHVDIVSPEEKLFSGMCELVVANASFGEIGIAPRHAPLITEIKPGPVRVIKQGGEEEIFYISGGMLEVQPYAVTILADTAVRAHDVDEAAAEEAKRQAQDAMSRREADFDYARAQAQLAEAVAQLKALQAFRKKRK